MANFAQLLVLLLLYVTANVESGVTVVDEVYQGITVALDSSLSADRCETLVNNLKKKLEESSRVLKETIGLRYGKIYVVIPKEWENCGSHYVTNIRGHVTWNEADIRIGPIHPVFGNQPWTDQFQSCGLPGNFIYLPEAFVNVTDFAGNVIVHEWAKYRWGVFEEYGIPGDTIFPSLIPFENEDLPNLCTNRKATGFESCEVQESCRYKFKNDSNKLISSSIMAVPEIPNAKFFCNEKSHKSKYPNKHNLLCDGNSAWDVMKRHSDFAELNFLGKAGLFQGNAYDIGEPLELKLIRENIENTLVIAVENTDSTSDATNRLAFIKESVSQFIKFELLDTYKVGFVEFTDIPEKIMQLTDLDQIGRDLLIKEVMSMKASKKTSTDIQRAVEVSSEILGEGRGIIMLITGCPDRIDQFKLQQMVSLAKENRVWVILYPYKECSQAEMLAELTVRTGGQIVYIQDDILPAEYPYVSPTIRMSLSQSYRSLLHSESDYHIQQIHKETCMETEVWCKREILVPEDFDQLHYLYFYHDYKEHVFASSEVTVVGDGHCDIIEMSAISRATKIFKCSLNKLSKISISVERDRPSDILIFELVGNPSRLSSDYNINIWCSSPVHNLTYSATAVPAVQAELTYQNRRITNANVTLRIEAETIGGDDYSHIQLNDEGVGADVTGNDGIYSGYVLPIPLDKTVVLAVFADNNDKTAMIWPEQYDSKNKEKIICCGSKLPTSRNGRHKETFALSVFNVPVSIHVDDSYSRIAPSQVRDLVAVQDGNKIKLTFTSPGQNLDQGTAKYYVLTYYEGSLERQSYTDKVDVTPKISGSQESIIIELKNCSSVHGFTVAASNNKLNTAKDSNLAMLRPVCNRKGNKGKSSAGKTVGIVFGVLFLILLIVLLVFWLRRRKLQKNQQHTNGKRVKNGRLVEEGRQIEPIEMTAFSRPIRSIEDLTNTSTNTNVTYLPAPLSESSSKSKSMDNLEVNELVRKSIIQRKQSEEQSLLPKGNLATQKALNSSNPNIIGIPLLLNEAIEYKKEKERKSRNLDLSRADQIRYPYSTSSLSSDGTEI